MAPVQHRVTIAWSRFRDLRRVLGDESLRALLRLRLFRSSVISSLLYVCESWRLTDRVKLKLNSTVSKMTAKITGRSIADEARTPSINVVLIARDLRWNWLGHILRVGKERLIRQVPLDCVTPTPDSILGNIPNLYVQAAMHLASNRLEWKT